MVRGCRSGDKRRVTFQEGVEESEVVEIDTDNYGAAGNKVSEGWCEEELGGKEAKHVDEVQKMLVDWELYENGWFIVGYSNNHLFNYRCQLGNPPKGVSYFSCIFPIAC